MKGIFMRNPLLHRLSLFICLLIVNAAHAAPAPAPAPAPTKPQQIGVTPKLIAITKPATSGIKTPLGTQCPDPAIVDFSVIPVSHNADGTYNFGIALIVKNVGTAKYVSRAGQQLVSLSQEGRNLINQDFGNLDPGATSTTFYKRIIHWNATPGEFGVNLEALISYDPDIFIDGNLQNDECSNRNNRKTITVADINRKLHIPGF
jgi:hypothetical protein